MSIAFIEVLLYNKSNCIYVCIVILNRTQIIVTFIIDTDTEIDVNPCNLQDKSKPEALLMDANNLLFNTALEEYAGNFRILKQVDAVGSRLSASALVVQSTRWIVKTGCREEKPREGGRSHDVTNLSSRALSWSVISSTAVQNQDTVRSREVKPPAYLVFALQSATWMDELAPEMSNCSSGAQKDPNKFGEMT